MIRFRHALTLANTKLRSKRVLLFISIVISSILFAALIAGIIVFTAAEKSAVDFVTKANEGVYRVEVNPVIPETVYSYNRPLSIEDIRHIRQVEKQYYAELEAKYKAAGIAYDKKTEVSALKPSAFFPPSLPEEQRFDIVFDSPIMTYDQNLKIAEYVKHAKNKISDLQRIGEQYGATGYYSSGQTSTFGIPNIMFLKNGKEDFNDMELKAGNLSTYGYAVNSIHNSAYQTQDQTLLARYLLKASTDKPITGIPVVVTAQEVASLFGKGKSISEEPKDPQQKSAWLKTIQDRFAGYMYQACYRNSAEIEKIQKIQRDYAEIVNNKNNKDYVEPSLQYNLPTEGCGAVTAKKDIRTTAEKTADAKQIENQKKLGTYIEPLHKLLTFEIVGIVNARPYSQYTADIQSYLQNLLAADNFNSSAYIPQQMYDKLPDDTKFVRDTSDASRQFEGLAQAGLVTHVLDFKTIDQARAFITNETCPSSETQCKKLFTSSPYGSNYLILDEIGKLFSKFMLYALPVVLGLATIVIWFTMMRVMAENRKETAVYRAMGAKRRDIMSIYITYGMIIALRIAVISAIAGVGAAFAIDYVYGKQLTAIAAASFGTITDGTHFSLFNLTSPYLLVVIGAIFVISFLAILQPLIRSVRRSPIEDMRSE
jgi:hypothetical protein